MLKQEAAARAIVKSQQPPSGGCVLKPEYSLDSSSKLAQPPSGGCVLKPCNSISLLKISMAATFGWLCVETLMPL